MQIKRLDMPMPHGGRGRKRGALSEAIKGLSVGEAIEVEASIYRRSTVQAVAKRAGAAFITKKLENGNYGIWRVS